MVADERAGAVGRSAGLAERGTSLGAWRAGAAAGNEHRDHPIADGEIAHARPDLLDDSRALMAECHGHGPRPRAVHHREIGVAEPCRLDAHEHLARPRLVEPQLLDLKGAGLGEGPVEPDGMQDGSAHGGEPTSRPSSPLMPDERWLLAQLPC